MTGYISKKALYERIANEESRLWQHENEASSPYLKMEYIGRHEEALIIKTWVGGMACEDVQPERFGKWRRYAPFTDTLECDQCNYQIIDENFKSNYCPNCGAKMTDEREQEE